MLTVVNELLQTRRELEKVREQLRVVSQLILQSNKFISFLQLQVNSASSSSETSSHSEPLLNLPVEYNGQTRELRELPSRMATSDLLVCTFNHQQSIKIELSSSHLDSTSTYFRYSSSTSRTNSCLK